MEAVTSVGLSARPKDGHVEIRIGYAGRGLPPEKLSRLFEPSFEIARKRVEAKTWSLFSARQVVCEQGGDITAFSDPGGETGFLVELPLDEAV